MICGTGGLAQYLERYLKKEVKIVAYVNSFKEEKEINGKPVVAEADIVKYTYDYIVIAFSNFILGKDRLRNLGVLEEKMVAYHFNGTFYYSNNPMQSMFDDTYREQTNGNMIPEIFDLPEKRYYLCSMIKADMKMPIEYDFVREKTLELLIDEIKRKNITGSCAELGVYRGEFARKINGSLSDRTLYLYDTYEGFNDSEVKNDNSINWGTKLEHFKDTSIESVLNHMPAREKCVIRKGFFPETFTEQSERFAFVSIDVDLYDPIKNGLDTFYPY